MNTYYFAFDDSTKEIRLTRPMSFWTNIDYSVQYLRKLFREYTLVTITNAFGVPQIYIDVQRRILKQNYVNDIVDMSVILAVINEAFH